MQLIDTHCHLNFQAFSADFLYVAKRSKERGVEKVVIVGSDSKTSKQAIDVARVINDDFGERWAYVAVGIHPTHFKDIENFSLIEKMVEDELVVAIGETGLDMYRNEEGSLESQRQLLHKHIELAKKVHKPLIFHNRQADEFFEKELQGMEGLQGVFHCFSSDHNFAKKVIDMGFMISFTGNITYGNKKLKKVIKRAPIEQIMAETDAPYIVPEPQRSEGIERNEPYLVSEVIKKIAKEKELGVDEIAKQVYKNSIAFFGL